MSQTPTWTNQHGEKLRLEWDGDQAILHHADYDKPLMLDIRVIGFERDRPDELVAETKFVTDENLRRHAQGDILLSTEEQHWLLGQIVLHGLELHAKGNGGEPE